MSEREDAAASRYGYDLATLRATQRRFTVLCFAVMGVAAAVLAAWLGFASAGTSTGTSAGDFLVPFLVALGVGFVAFLLGVVVAQLLRQLTASRSKPFTDTAAVAVMTLMGLLAVSLFVDSWGSLVSALLGVVVATAGPMAIATSALTAVLRDTPNAESVAAELGALPSWSTLLGGHVKWVLVGVAADLAYRCAALALLWLNSWWFVPLLALSIVEAFVSSRGLASGNRVLWLAPGILTATAAVIAAVVAYPA